MTVKVSVQMQCDICSVWQTPEEITYEAMWAPPQPKVVGCYYGLHICDSCVEKALKAFDATLRELRSN